MDQPRRQQPASQRRLFGQRLRTGAGSEDLLAVQNFVEGNLDKLDFRFGSCHWPGGLDNGFDAVQI